MHQQLSGSRTKTCVGSRSRHARPGAIPAHTRALTEKPRSQSVIRAENVWKIKETDSCQDQAASLTSPFPMLACQGPWSLTEATTRARPPGSTRALCSRERSPEGLHCSAFVITHTPHQTSASATGATSDKGNSFNHHLLVCSQSQSATEQQERFKHQRGRTGGKDS